MMLEHLREEVVASNGLTRRLSADERAGGIDTCEADSVELLLDMGLPTWRYRVGAITLEKRIVLPHHQNSVLVTYRLLASPTPIVLQLSPSLHFRPHEGPVTASFPVPYKLSFTGPLLEITGPPPYPALRLRSWGRHAQRWVLDGGTTRTLTMRTEQSRGYDHESQVWTPGFLQAEMEPGDEITFLASTESWATIEALSPTQIAMAEQERRAHLLSRAPLAPSHDLVFAADQFLVAPSARLEDSRFAEASGRESETVIAGYPWFTDWGRDTMIGLEGLTLTTGRHTEAASILLTFARYVRDGLIPNLFPEGGREGLYHTADASLWYFHAVHRYVLATGDRETLRALLPVLVDIAEHHLRGTSFGIGVDPQDGLLRQGADGYQLTWMDAKVDGWVVTPRRGKAVEINALFYNALRLLEGWLREEDRGKDAGVFASHAARAWESFQMRFWCERRGHLFDVVDGENGDDDALRPNQLLAFSLAHEILERSRWRPVLEMVTDALLTPVGLRTLSRDHPDYKPRYDGDLRSRDAAYHQGTVWAWLIGPYVDAYLKVNPTDLAGARKLLAGFEPHLLQAGLGSISEIFDAEPPYTPRGCVAQAWSVAEVLRCLARTTLR
jgi:predicted glycogen debranching enzyme